MQNILFTRNVEQAALFEFELSGQISDGFWENARPYDHWQVWCDAQVAVATEGQVGCTFYARRSNYNFANPELLDVVGYRMLGIARIARNLGLDVARTVHALYVLDTEADAEGNPMINLTGEGDYFDKKRAAFATLDADAINAALKDQSYSYRDMVADLRDLSRIIKIRVEVL